MRTMMQTMKSVVVCTLIACGFATSGFAGSNTKNVLTMVQNGSQKYVSTGTRLIDFSGSYTIGVWVKLNKEGMTGSNKQGEIIGQDADAANMFKVYYDKDLDQIVYVRRRGWSYAATDYSYMDAPASGEWHYLTVVFDMENHLRKMYLDGELKTSDSDAGTAAPDAKTVFRFGFITWVHYFVGQLAEMSVWKGAFDAAQIASIMTARPVGDALSNCIGYWPFDEGDGGLVAADLSSGNHPFTLINASYNKLESTDDFPDFRVVSPRFAVTHTLAYDLSANALTVTATPTEPPPGTDLKVVVTAPDGTAETNTFAISVGDGESYQTVLTGLDRDTAYTITVIAVDAFNDVTSSTRTAYTGAISIEPVKSTVTDYGEDGVFVISRGEGEAATAYDLIVRYEISGTAENGVDYKTLTGTVVIPAGASSAEVVASQLADCPHSDDLTVVLTLATDGDYAIGAKSEAEITKTFFVNDNEKDVLDVTANSAALTTGKQLAPGTSFTLTGWVKLDKESMTGNGYIMGQQDNAQYVYMLYYSKSTDEIIFARRSGGWGYSASHYTRAPAPASGEWHFYTAVWDSSSMTRRLYIDSALKAEDAGTGTTKPNVNFTMVYNGYAGYFRGSLAEIGLWNKALTEDEIKTAMWNRPEGDALADCIAYWPLDDGSQAPTARDLTATAATLTIPNVNNAKLETTNDFVDFNEGDARITFNVTLFYPTNGVSVAVSGTEMVGEAFVAGSEATFAASTTTGKTFLRWYGDVDEEDAYNTTVTIVVDTTKTLAPVYAFDWLYDAKAKTITDGYWVLNVTASGTELTVSGINAASAKDASSRNFVTLLDLRKRVADANETTYDIVSFGAGSFSGVSTLQEVRVPDTLRTIGGTWWDNGAFYNCTALTNMTPFLPSSVNYIGICAFSGDTKLTGDLVLGDKEGTFTLPWANTSLAYFQNTAIKSVTAKENVRWIRAQMFNGCSQLESVTLEGNVTNIEANAFAGCSALKLFSLGHRPETWPGYQGSTAYKCRFLVNATDPGWAAYMADSAKFTPWGSLDQTAKDKYTAVFPGVKKPIGLSKTLPANQWLCNLKELGMKLIFR